MPLSESSSSQSERLPIAIVGAGPYGLSLAAHLASAKLPFRIFGRPLTTWREHMPRNMLLKSDGFASSLSAPFAGARLEDFCAAGNLPYRPTGLPVPLTRFVDYADWFQKRFVPGLEPQDVAAIGKRPNGFDLTLSDGTAVECRSVVMATGISWFSRIPDVLSGLPSPLVSHSADHRTADEFASKRVVVVGAGASAIDTAWLFAEADAEVRILSRQQRIIFHNPPGPRSLAKRIRSPQTGIGPGLRSKFFTSAPLLFRRFPDARRYEIAHGFPPPSPGWFMTEKIEGRVPVLLGWRIRGARANGGEAELALESCINGESRTLTADHIVAATGYSVDLRRVPILDPALRDSIAHYRNAPRLSDDFESSVEGLYFVGPAAAPTFGPLMRFVVGAEWAVPRLARHLARRARAAASH